MLGNIDKLRNGRFYYSDNQTDSVYILRKGDQQIDFIKDVQLKSKIVWLQPNAYKLILESISNPEKINLEIGDVLYVSIKEITSDYFLTETEYKGSISESKLWFAAA